MKLTDAHTKLRTDCAAVYKRYDRDLQGQVSRQEFAKIHRELVREKLVKLDLDSCVSLLDAKGDGIVYFNDFVSWVERVSVTRSLLPNSHAVGAGQSGRRPADGAI
jgi:Ca2+-binding EF-hand superfamily protein